MMTQLIVLVFITGYICIAFEHKLKIDKAASALLTGVVCWLLLYLVQHSQVESEKLLLEKLGDISAILFFLLGAMTIVEVIDSHNGFVLITNLIHTRSKNRILILIALITFFMSAILDNLTTAIVMTSLSRKLLSEKSDRLWFAALIIIAANAGGAWSPLGDVTTTMLWIGKQITPWNIVAKTLIPSLVAVAVPMTVMLFRFRGHKIAKEIKSKSEVIMNESNVILFSGIGLLIFVPVFKTLTHMPPFMGMLISLGLMWIISSLIHIRKQPEERIKFSVTTALKKIDTSSILFFLGILLAVSALEAMGTLSQMAGYITHYIKNIYITGTILGILSSVIDNVPLVAAAQGMFNLQVFPTDHVFWEYLALSAGTGGSAIIIGSAAGVAVMGIEKIDFFWYIKNISLLALSGFFAGLGTYILQQWLFG